MFRLHRELRNRCWGLAFVMMSSGAVFAQVQDDESIGGADVIQTDEDGALIQHLENGVGEGDVAHDSSTMACRRYDRAPSVCQQQYGCSYDYRLNICIDANGGGGGGLCQRYNYDYRNCVNSGCLFDGNSGACYGNVNPNPPQPYPPHPYPPGPNPNFCSQYSYNQHQCQSAGCFYDHRNGSCFALNTPGPGPGPSPFRFVCNAVDVSYEEHHRGHMGIGRTQYDAQQAAMGDCLRQHGRCRIRDCRQQ